METTSLKVKFWEMVDRLIQERTADLVGECRFGVLTGLVRANINFLDQYVATVQGGEHESFAIMYDLGLTGGSIGGRYVFFSGQDFYKFIESGPVPNNPKVQKIDRSELSQDREALEQIVVHIENAPLAKRASRIVIPQGFFVFKYTAQWTAGGYEDKEVSKEIVIEAPTLEEAVENFKNILGCSHENCFWDVRVYTSEGSHFLTKPGDVISNYDLFKIRTSAV